MSGIVRMTGVLLLFALFSGTPAAHGGKFSQGRWKVELTGGTGVNASSTDRKGDILVTLAAEYEFPITSRITLGPRILPFFLYEPDEEDDERVWGGGLGFVPRYYFSTGEYRGLYAELEGHAVVHRNRIKNINTNFNFLIGGGLGYRFRNNWHGTVKFEHLSNGGLGSQNSGTNTTSLAVGYSF